MSPASVPDTLPIDGELWRFTLRVYRQEGVSAACIDLQERCGVNVVLLLFAGWAAAVLKIELSSEDASDLQNKVNPWHQQIVTTLRSVRRSLKSGPKPAPSVETEALRTDIKAAELQAERIELAYLEHQTSHWLQSKASDAEVSIRSSLETILRLTASAASMPENSGSLDVLESAFQRAQFVNS